MSVWKLVKLKFGRSPTHFGELGIGMEETSERVRSDSLFSAWVTAYARLWGKDAVAELLQNFPISSSDDPDRSPLKPPFSLSSTFIFQERGDKTLYYLPKPLKFPLGYPVGEDLDFTKTYKSLAFLPLDLWHRWYQEKGFTPNDSDDLINYAKKHLVNALCKAGTSYEDAFKHHTVPKIAVDRTTRATNLYHVGFVHFQWEKNSSGLYFLLHFPEENPTLEDRLRSALNILGEEGIGGERSSGAGRFEAEWLPLPDEWESVVNFSSAQYHSLISTFWDSPISPDLLNDASYELKERGGWISSPSSGQQLRRQAVRMFTEGSVFSAVPQGKLVDVTPNGRLKFQDHPIYRSGISMSLPIKIQPNTQGD